MKIYIKSASYSLVQSDSPLLSSILGHSPEFAGIVNQFIEKLPEIIRTINTAYEENNWALFKNEVHKLKGIGGGLGFPQITELSANIEIAYRVGDYPALESRLAELENVAKRIESGHQMNLQIHG